MFCLTLQQLGIQLLDITDYIWHAYPSPLTIIHHRKVQHMALTKADLVGALQKEIGFNIHKSINIVESLLETIKSTLESGEDVLVSGFGNFF